MPTSVFRFNKCGDRFLIVFGMFIVGVTMFSILSGTLGKVYDIRACCDLLATFLEKSLFEVCVLTEIDEIHETRCVKLNDPLLKGTGADEFATRQQVTIAFLFTTISIAIVIIILGFLDCCHVISLDKNIPFSVLLFLSFLLLGCATVTASVPTNEYEQQKKTFNNLSTRNSSFYYAVLYNFAHSDIFPIPSRHRIMQDLGKPDLKVKFGWVLGMIWTSAAFAFLAFVTFALSRCCVLKKLEEDNLESPRAGTATGKRQSAQEPLTKEPKTPSEKSKPDATPEENESRKPSVKYGSL
ncbi:uncharacterized protein LOC142335507 isoform X1 [Convolutriloba macropyga]|uniref:uncharacterized protein LOC142335507 isoform X1 n=1 Tax=Convolutriloba macropyga TaxID=536237 RepID=UPI003F51AE61